MVRAEMKKALPAGWEVLFCELFGRISTDSPRQEQG